MRYVLSIYADENGPQGEMDEWYAYDQAIRQSGIVETGEALQPTPTATTVRVRGGERMLTDGPFAETKEQLGGFYVVNCKDLDEALAWAERMPNTKYGSVEVRPIMEFEGS
jgi:hypothetical protein